MDIRYFFLKDLIERDVVKVEYCPTEQMVADFFTKPLQGNLFYKLKRVIMGTESVEEFKRSFDTKERVGTKVVSKKNCAPNMHTEVRTDEGRMRSDQQ